MSSRTAVLCSFDVGKSIKLHDRKSVVWDTGKETVVSVEGTKEMELFLLLRYSCKKEACSLV